MFVDSNGNLAIALTISLTILLTTMISALIISIEDDKTQLTGPNIEFSGPEFSLSATDFKNKKLSFISLDAYFEKKESKKRDKLNGYTYFKFLNAGINIGITSDNKNLEKNKLLNFDLSIFETGYSNDYFSISFSIGADPIDISFNLYNIIRIFI